MKVCSLADCDRPAKTRGMCRMHYLRWYRHGDPAIVKMVRIGERKHGHSRSRNGRQSPTYLTWVAMWTRCSNPKQSTWPNYGGRGIGVCIRWEKFEHFLADMGERPEGKTLDRLDNDDDYTPSNCRWATRSEQRRNRRDMKQ